MQEYDFENVNDDTCSVIENGTAMHKMSYDVTEILLNVLEDMVQYDLVERDHNNMWVTTKKWRALVVTHRFREENET